LKQISGFFSIPEQMASSIAFFFEQKANYQSVLDSILLFKARRRAQLCRLGHKRNSRVVHERDLSNGKVVPTGNVTVYIKNPDGGPPLKYRLFEEEIAKTEDGFNLQKKDLIGTILYHFKPFYANQ
jgi:hypothetical protein